MAADGSIVFQTELDNKKVQSELNALTKKISNLESTLEQAGSTQTPLIQQAEALQKQMASATAEAAKYKQEWLSGVMGADKDEGAAIEKAAQLRTEYNAVLAEVEKYDVKIGKTNTELDAAKTKAGALANQLAGVGESASKTDRATARAAKSMGMFATRLRGILLSAFVFNIISAGLRSFTKWASDVIQSNDEAAAAIAKLKGALLTLAQPLVNVIIPAFITLVNVLTSVINTISALFSNMFGTTIEDSRQAAEGLYDQSHALNATGAAAKKAEKSLASFDEVNKLSSNDSSGGGGAGANGIAPDFSAFDAGAVKGQIEELATYLMGALLVVGAILTFTGANIPLGIGLMAVGAVGLAAQIAVNWNSMSPGLQEAITNTLLVLGTAGLVIGAILAFSGANIPLGIGLMVAGAVALGTAVALNWESISQALQGPIAGIVLLVSGALLAIGAVLAFSGAALPLGIGLMVAGAVGLAAVVAVNWETISQALEGPIGGVVAVVSAALLVLGAIFTFTGAAIPLGIGLMIAGATGLAATVAVNWDAIQTALQGPMGQVTAMVSGALLVLGAILTFTGAALPLGIGLMAAGAIGLATVVAVNWDSIVTALRGPVGEVTAIVSGALLVLGIILVLTGVGLPLGIALIAAGAIGLVTVTALNWDAILDKLKDVWSGIKNWWNTYVAKFFTADYWLGLGKDILDGLFNGLSEIGKRICDWGSGFINGVKDFFGIHSPSTEFESLGGYMMAGLENGVAGNTDSTTSAFSVMFDSVETLEENSMDAMRSNAAAFLSYLSNDFTSEWKTAWVNCYYDASSNIGKVMSQIDTLNLKLAAIERNIVIKVTTSQSTISTPQASGKKSTASTYAAGAISFADLPELATGAVIPPNQKFAAILGDQRSGRNIETPEGLLRQIYREESGNGAIVSELREILSAIREGKVMMVDKRELGVVMQEALSSTTRSGMATMPVR